jgi:ABC-type transporter Mla subunit MlaD
MRQLKQQGWTTAGRDGGAFTAGFIRKQTASLQGYTRHNEPLGIFMNQLTEAKKDIDATSEAVSASARKMVDSATRASADMTEASRKMRDATEKLTTQMQKFHSAFANTKFDDQAKAATSLADAMERLAALEEKGLLSKVMAALGK